MKDFILDFYCHEYLLWIEVDGEVHNDDIAREYDLNRTAELESLGLTIIRFKNEEVLNNISIVKPEMLIKLEGLFNKRAKD